MTSSASKLGTHLLRLDTVPAKWVWAKPDNRDRERERQNEQIRKYFFVPPFSKRLAVDRLWEVESVGGIFRSGMPNSLRAKCVPNCQIGKPIQENPLIEGLLGFGFKNCKYSRIVHYVID